MIVYLLRHGIAEDLAGGGSDADRALTDEGIARLEHAGRSWRQLVQRVDHIFASPLRRARQTAEILARTCCKQTPVGETKVLLPGAAPAAAQEVLQGQLLAGTHGVACVGHEPHLGHLLGLLLTGTDQCGIPLRKGMLVAVEVTSPATMTGRLRFALGQRQAAELGH